MGVDIEILIREKVGVFGPSGVDIGIFGLTSVLECLFCKPRSFSSIRICSEFSETIIKNGTHFWSENLDFSKTISMS